jgi:hypothetical protein
MGWLKARGVERWYLVAWCRLREGMRGFRYSHRRATLQRSRRFGVNTDRTLSLTPRTMSAMTTYENTRDRLAHVINQWLPMWNGDHELVEDLVAPEFRIWFGAFPGAGDSVADPTTFQDFLTSYRAQFADARFTPGEMAVDEAAGRGALVWTLRSTPPGEDQVREVGGVDQFTFVEGRVRQVWSMGGAEPRPF